MQIEFYLELKKYDSILPLLIRRDVHSAIILCTLTGKHKQSYYSLPIKVKTEIYLFILFTIFFTGTTALINFLKFGPEGKRAIYSLTEAIKAQPIVLRIILGTSKKNLTIS